MDDHGLALTALGAATMVYVLALFSPVPEVGFVLQLVGLGGAFGTLVGLMRERRDPRVQIARYTAFGGSVGLCLGLLLVAVGSALRGVT